MKNKDNKARAEKKMNWTKVHNGYRRNSLGRTVKVYEYHSKDGRYVIKRGYLDTHGWTTTNNLRRRNGQPDIDFWEIHEPSLIDQGVNPYHTSYRWLEKAKKHFDNRTAA